MADFIYCGTEPPVGADGTQQLLVGPHNAIWCPPANLPVEPAEGDRVWLVWRANARSTPVLLGGGRVLITNEGEVLWTNRTLPGVRPAAQDPAIGYPGPTNMAFLHLGGVVAPEGQPAVTLGAIENGLNQASAAQVHSLSQLLAIA